MESPPPGVCPGCGASADAADNFCETCGRELAATVVSTGTASYAACRNCQSSRISADGYCEQCGRKAPAGRDHVELDLGVLAGVTDRGLRHHRNEDAMALGVMHTPTGPAAVGVVCDGVSTSDRPDEASLAAAEKTVHLLVDALRAGAASAEALTDAVLAANSAVHDLAGHSANPPAATYVAGVVTPVAVTVCWVGDSRAYWVAADSLPNARLLTRDDSVAQELIAAGAPVAADAMTAPGGHVVTRWLGADADDLGPHIASFEPPGPGVLLLCSDGLWNYQPDADALARLAMPKALTDLPGATAELLAFALNAGGHDNITIILIAVPPRQAGAATRHRSTPP